MKSLQQDAEKYAKLVASDPAPEPHAPPEPVDQAGGQKVAAGREEKDEPPRGGPKSQADRVVELVLATPDVDLFHTPDLEAYATIPVGHHREQWKVTSKGFREWLARSYYAKHKKVIGSQSIQDAVGAIAGLAKYEGAERSVGLRLAQLGGVIYLDLCDAEWRAVCVDADGWSVIASRDCPVRFVRRRGMEPMPVPVHGGSMDLLRPFVNLPDEQQWLLYVGWIVGALRPVGPYGVLGVSGEHGSAKTTLCKIARRLIDPNQADLRRPPKDERDVFIAAGNSWVCGYNNLSGIRPEISDALCALATDGGFATRSLYTDDDETIFTARRPVMLNGIDEPASRPDLVDRTISLFLTPIAEENRKTEEELMAGFEEVRPLVQGAALSAISSALRHRSTVRLARKPRMADLAIWVAAAEPGLAWRPGTFLDAYFGNRAQSNTEVLESSPVAVAVLRLLEGGPWSGTASELLDQLNRCRASGNPPRDWPDSAKAMASALRRLAPNLRAAGLQVDLPTKAVGRNKRRIFRLEPAVAQPSASSAPPVNPSDVGGSGPLDAKPADHGPGRAAEDSVAWSAANGLPTRVAAPERRGADGADHADHAPGVSAGDAGDWGTL